MAAPTEEMLTEEINRLRQLVNIYEAQLIVRDHMLEAHPNQYLNELMAPLGFDSEQLLAPSEQWACDAVTRVTCKPIMIVVAAECAGSFNIDRMSCGGNENSNICANSVPADAFTRGYRIMLDLPVLNPGEAMRMYVTNIGTQRRRFRAVAYVHLSRPLHEEPGWSRVIRQPLTVNDDGEPGEFCPVCSHASHEGATCSVVIPGVQTAMRRDMPRSCGCDR